MQSWLEQLSTIAYLLELLLLVKTFRLRTKDVRTFSILGSARQEGEVDGAGRGPGSGDHDARVEAQLGQSPLQGQEGQPRGPRPLRHARALMGRPGKKIK